MQLNKIHTLEATLELVTGLHIGGSTGEMHIGGIDNSVLKHPYTLEPYIPGSSLKGKMRSLLEWRAGVVGECSGKPVSAQAIKELSGEKKERAERIARLFGLSGDAKDDFIKEIGPTRLSFWDCALKPEWVAQRQAGELLTEAKSENLIDRISGVAQHPRQTERVPAGALFDFKLSFKELDIDTALLDTILQGLKLLELDAIGGSGSRGYGKIKFNQLTLNGEAIDERFATIDPFA
ncbi:type III-A CRISPR-associated RAMP protein Csm3 [Oceanobacter sp. 3_MG-2023]|jgi:CRISPR-associated protein Csm3|uniref:type III-A CRISPR-associated RAMP protein Csm3 n=1 Tax=Oceanobacter sp. 3_MG-2023 TaxID=3062622 RepID=UPI002735DA34|nr:type III-A CRISPR-associated RAMP protein Csm3 [Oceanobacter sp. 3_MG-2023]MDP2505797.1 type III-A CRISPR-associated RAMP protein Csm3 [Oceanobacter sp. 3_MG-2023]